MKLPQASRFCGDCHVCCILPAIPGLKAADQPCPRLREFGCATYAQRPTSCSRYRCGYLGGAVDQRPSETGLLVQGSNRDIEIAEVWAGAWDGADRDAVLATIVARTRAATVTVRRHRDRRPAGYARTVGGARVFISGATGTAHDAAAGRDAGIGGTAISGGGFFGTASSFDFEG